MRVLAKTCLDPTLCPEDHSIVYTYTGSEGSTPGIREPLDDPLCYLITIYTKEMNRSTAGQNFIYVGKEFDSFFFVVVVAVSHLQDSTHKKTKTKTKNRMLRFLEV